MVVMRVGSAGRSAAQDHRRDRRGGDRQDPRAAPNWTVAPIGWSMSALSRLGSEGRNAERRAHPGGAVVADLARAQVGEALAGEAPASGAGAVGAAGDIGQVGVGGAERDRRAAVERARVAGPVAGQAVDAGEDLGRGAGAAEDHPARLVEGVVDLDPGIGIGVGGNVGDGARRDISRSLGWVRVVNHLEAPIFVGGRSPSARVDRLSLPHPKQATMRWS